MYLLATVPNIMSRLREEILNKVGNSRRPNYDDIRDMKYLRAVINGESFHYSLTSLGKAIKTIRNTSALSYRVRKGFCFQRIN